MLLTLSTTRQPATDLSFLLHKHPARVQSVEIKSGKAHIFYPEATDERTTCALLLDLDPVALVRGGRDDQFALQQYVNDRPYVASSFLSTAIAKAFSSALNGNCTARPELPEEALPLEAELSVVPARGGAELIARLFEPLGYEIESVQHPLDEAFPQWGDSPYFSITLRHTLPLRLLLSHLYVLVPVLDNEKHYWVDRHEAEKLLQKGAGWLERHPEKTLITSRYLRYQKSLTTEALAALMKDDAPEEVLTEVEVEETAPKPRLHDLRLQAVFDELVASGAASVLDLGCGEGKLMRLLMAHRGFTRITGMDVETRALERAAERLRLDRLPEHQKGRVSLLQGSLVYRDARLEGYDAAALVEVIEHLDAERLRSAEEAVFRFAAPGTVVVTTPNKEWNATFTEDEAQMRHDDHRFEWTRAEFERWCAVIGERYGYTFITKPLGEEDAAVGAPSQMAIFKKERNGTAE